METSLIFIQAEHDMDLMVYPSWFITIHTVMMESMLVNMGLNKIARMPYSTYFGDLPCDPSAL